MDMTHITIPQALAVVVLGMVTVFAVLLLLMLIITVESKIIAGMEESKKAAAPAPATPVAAPPAAAPAPVAKGSCGGVMLHDVPDRTAAMIMAIVADGLNTPLNELRFISIKEVK